MIHNHNSFVKNPNFVRKNLSGWRQGSRHTESLLILDEVPMTMESLLGNGAGLLAFPFRFFIFHLCKKNVAAR